LLKSSVASAFTSSISELIACFFRLGKSQEDRGLSVVDGGYSSVIGNVSLVLIGLLVDARVEEAKV
jgi:hypothetical protein